MKLYAFFMVVSIALLLTAQASRAQWDDCRFGEEECTGECGQFVDTDGDGICDHSQPAPEDRTEDVSLDTQFAQNGPETEEPKIATARKTYYFAEITALIVAAYALTYALARKGRISLVAHRKVWNVMLLATFIVSGILGLLLVIRINYGWAPLQHFVMLNLHVEAGIAMALISIFHVAWHWKYYACIIRRGYGGKKCE